MAESAKPTPRDELRASIRGLGLTVRSSPPLAGSMLVLTVASGVAPALVVAQTGRFLQALPEAVRQGAGSPPWDDVQRALVLVAGAVFLTQVLAPIQQAVLFGLQRRFESYLARRLMAATLALPGLAWFEDSGFRDELAVSHWIGFGPVHTLQALVQVFQQFFQIVAMAAVAALFAGWVPVVVILGCLPAGVATWHYQATVGLSRWRGSPEARRADYYRDLSTLREAGKELRIFRLGAWARERQARHWLASVAEMWDTRRRTMLVLLGLNAVALAVMAGAYLAMLSSAVGGRTDVGTFTAAVTATIALLAAVLGVFKEAANARRMSFYLPSALRILDLPAKEPRLEVRPAGDTPPVTVADEHGIRFSGVTFAYPGTDRQVLDGLDLWVPAGSSLAIVGENGAGKTTLIKLVGRFYDPTDGTITLDGVDIRDLDLAELRARMAVIFQDFVRYQLAARDNVGFGAVARAGDQALLDGAAGAVGVLDRIRALPDGWDTPLAREFGGVDLSGGEWQRIALARAIMAQRGRDADLLVLDEPTASLDVRLEHELYRHFDELSRDRTTLLVSHRFSTVQMAGRIVLLAGGRVVEDGSHADLIAANGRYAELYRLQASHYRRTGKLE